MVSFSIQHFECIFFYKKCFILIPVSLKFVSMGPINDNLTLVQIKGDFYVFSLFPPPPHRLLSLTSKPFELNLRYLGQRIYRSREMYWMTFQWPWPKVTAWGSTSKNLFVCMIMWEPLIQSLQSILALLPLSEVMVITWLDFGEVLLETVILANFL